MKEDTPDILDLLIKHELTIKRLYVLFAAVFTGHRELWERLVADEQRHADSLAALRSDPTAVRWLTEQTRVRPAAIRSSIQYVETQAARAHQGGLSQLQALAIAKDLEGALLEKELSRLSAAAPGETGATLAGLVGETERHRAAVSRAMEAERR